MSDSAKEPGLLVKMMAKRCDLCPPCRYARSHPDSTIGKVVAFHGKYCPFWKAWQKVYGAKQEAPPGQGA